MPLLFVASEENNFIATLAILMPPLIYMAGTACWSIHRLKIRGWYGLYKNHLTDVRSLLWFVYIPLRLAAPLCYHFICLVRVEGTAFQDFFRQMDLVALGNIDGLYSPIILLLVVFNVLGVYERLTACLGKYINVSVVEFEGAPGKKPLESLLEGQRIIDRE